MISQISNWKDAIQVAVLGLSRFQKIEFRSPWFIAPNNLEKAQTLSDDQLELQHDELDQAHELIFLDYISCSVLYQTAGKVGRVSQDLNLGKLSPAPVESKRVYNQVNIEFFDQILDHQSHLVRQYFDAFVEADLILNPNVYSKLIEFGLKHKNRQKKSLHTQLEPDLIPSLLSLMGERGRWLIQLNPNWHRAYWLDLAHHTLKQLDQTTKEEHELNLEQEIKRLWLTADINKRSEVLTYLRQHTPQKALFMIEEGFAKESAQTRKALIEILQMNLSMTDEAFLETCLDDKSKTVRAEVVKLLCQLPHSQFAQRQIDRLKNYINLKGLRAWLTAHSATAQDLNLIIQLPKSALTSDELRDHLGTRKPFNGGVRINRLAEIIAYVPLSFWIEHVEDDTETPAHLSMAVQLQRLVELVHRYHEKNHEHKLIFNSLNLAYLYQYQNMPLTQSKLWAEALIDLFQMRKSEPSHTFWSAIPKTVLLQKIQQYTQQKSTYCFKLLSFYQQAWSFELSQSMAWAISGTLKAIYDDELEYDPHLNFLYLCIKQAGQFGDLCLRDQLQRDWLAYQDMIENELDDALHECKRAFDLRVLLKHELKQLR